MAELEEAGRLVYRRIYLKGEAPAVDKLKKRRTSMGIKTLRKQKEKMEDGGKATCVPKIAEAADK